MYVIFFRPNPTSVPRDQSIHYQQASRRAFRASGVAAVGGAPLAAGVARAGRAGGIGVLVIAVVVGIHLLVVHDRVGVG